MAEGVGKKLHDARVQRGLSIEEVAHATKLRPDKIVALEHDDYARFPNNAYAKGFLQIYGRYLGVDISEPWQALDTSNRIAVGDYQYLTNGIHQQREPERATFSFSPKKPVPSIVPLVVFVAMLVVGVVGFRFYVDWKRVNNEVVLGKERKAAEETPATVQAESQPAANAPATPAPPTAAPAAAPLVPRAEAVNPGMAVSVPVPAPAATKNVVLVEPIKKTWIVVRVGDPKSAPIFEDYLYPDAPALPVPARGESVFIEARDPSAIRVRKNGVLIAYTPGAEIR
jgi:cytoskeletal protein RodZ